MLNEKIELNRLGVWQKYFIKPYDQESYGILRAGARLRTDNFLKDVRDKAINIDDGFDSASHCPELDKWVESETGQTTLTSLLEELQDLVKSSFELLEDRQTKTRQQLLPIGHDRWQMAKDAAEALRYLEMERPQGYKAAFVIPTAFHDLGRILEGWMMDDKNPHTNWIPHAQLSFLMLDDVLSQQKYQAIPKELKNHFLYAVLAHSYSENGQSYMSRAVQACDRMQLIGPEGIFRTLAYDVCYNEQAVIGYPSSKKFADELPILHDIHEAIPGYEYIARGMLENIGASHARWRQELHIETLAILMAYQGAEKDRNAHILAPKLLRDAQDVVREHRFCPESLDQAKSKLGQNFDHIYLLLSPKELLDEVVKELQRPAGAASLTDRTKAHFLSSLISLDEGERKSLCAMVRVAGELRKQQEQADLLVIERAMVIGDRLTQAIARPNLDLFVTTVPSNDVRSGLGADTQKKSADIFHRPEGFALSL